ncbi:MAG: isoprenylcysteine carboxylmethyltransferase family protein [Clostridia bacterium]|nr:isoprenylcysteine carboxylmethyltransferase family protein [Clostridia bacterium]
MYLRDSISLVLFIIFASSYLLKIILLAKRNKVNANVLGNRKKEKGIQWIERLVRIASSIWIGVWLLEIFLNRTVSKYIPFLINEAYLSYTGTLVIGLGVGVFITAMIFMKSSWRVGIDKETKSDLITVGIYKWSRNPAFVGFNLMFLGLFLSYMNMLTFFTLLINFFALHLLILQEEKHLKTSFGEDYEKYKEKTPRYF